MLPKPSKFIANFFLNITVICVVSAFTTALQAKPAKDKNSENLKPLSITTKPLSELWFYPTHSAPANVLSLNDSTLRSEIKGRVLAFEHPVGQNVEKGTNLVVLDCTDYEHTAEQKKWEIESIKAEINLTQWQLVQTRKLIKSHHISEETLKKQEAQLKQLQAQLNTHTASYNDAKNQISRCTIKAPFTGLITEKLANIGELATPGTPIIKMLDTKDLEIESRLHYNELMDLKQAKEVFLKIRRTTYPLAIRTILANQDPKTRTHLIRLTFLNKDKLAPPGSAGRLIWKNATPQIPAELLRGQHGQLGIFIVETVNKNKKNITQAKFVPLKNARPGQPANIDLPKDTPLIISGRYTVTDGQAVHVIKPKS